MLAVSMSSRRSRALRSLFAVAVLGAASSTAFATNYTVGIGCTYPTIQAAVNAAQMQVSGSRPVIYIVGNQQYDKQAIVTSAHSMSFIGGVADCTHLTPSNKTTINGNGTASVFSVTGTTAGQLVVFSHLYISGGGGSSGGGIFFNGAGAMNVDNATIDSNKATEGGGIRFIASGGAADLYINDNTSITNNTAVNSGGGIRAEGAATVHIDKDNTWLAFNKATNGQGGAVLVYGAMVHIGSPGLKVGNGYAGVIFDNVAQYGGGVAALSNGNGVAAIELYASDAANPVIVEQNRAYNAGGGLYVKPFINSNTFIDGAIQIGGAHVDNNVAAEGSGIYADEDFYSTFDSYKGGLVDMVGGYCTVGLVCNSVSNNVNEDSTNAPTTGSAILIQTDGALRTAQLTMRGNQGAHAIRVVDNLEDTVKLDTCLLTDNTVTGELVYLGHAAANITQCTLANNDIGGTAVLYGETGFSMTNSIVAQGALPTLHYSGNAGGASIDYVMSNETSTLSIGTHVINADPSFVDVPNGDYHLGATSSAIDIAPNGAATDRDLDNRARDQDLPNVTNLGGARDLGAYERQLRYCGAADTFFCDGFQQP
jgi:predicted outer membrane repeat protein